MLLDYLSNTLSIVLLIVGFGFVIFWHELGHFLAAKWVGIKVEQFAVGMGHAIVSFRKGIGWRWGNTRAEYEGRIKQYLDARNPGESQEEYSEAQVSRAADELGLGETEYRLSWIPVGGYVKMLGQDDLRPGADADDPRAFNKKSVPQRMLVVSAGVIMNIILAAILFMVLFLYGFRAPAPVVGQVLAGSPAQQAGLRPGDTILTFDGQTQHDFTKVTLNTALASPNEPLHVKVRRADGKEETLDVQPVKPEGTSKAFLALGITSSSSLEGIKQREWPAEPENPDLEYPGVRTVRPGDVIAAINGQAVRPSATFKDGDAGDYWRLVDAVQQSGGKPVELTIKRKDGKVETVALRPHFQLPFLDEPPYSFNIAGMQPRMRVEFIADKNSPVINQFKPGDVIKSIEVRNASVPASQPGDRAGDVSVPGFIKTVGEAGQKDRTIDFVVLRDGKEVNVKNIKANLKVGKDRNNNDRYGVGVAPGFDDQTPVIAAVVEKSPASAVKDGLPPGARITAVDGTAVQTWFDVRSALAAKSGDHTLTLATESGKPVQRTLSLSEKDRQALAEIRLAIAPLLLNEQIVVRKTANAGVALKWGVEETRDLILQFYVTLQRMFGGSVSASNLMGPVGIVGAGARFAFKGTDWLIWFLAMISANLAVVNFLPIPIVDGGLFLFLIIEKIQGKPLSRRTQELAQLAGILFIASVFVMVTFNDITRMFGR
ncbi:MAG TPA: site-2 protease family protein [Tepidisphaeraceae bacterium]